MKIAYYLTVTTLAVILGIMIAAPVFGAEFSDDEAGYAIEYDDAAWFIEDIANLFGDITEFDDKLVSDPLVLTGDDDSLIIVVVSERDDYESDILSFIEEMMGELVINDIYMVDEIFTDIDGDEFESLVETSGVAPEYEDEAIFLSQTFFTDGKRFQVCFLAMRDYFVEDYNDAVGIMDSINVD